MTKLPPALVETAAKLFDLGLADPRGGEYQRIKVVEGLPEDGRSSTISRRGWVLPPGNDPAHRFAVGWDGLIHPVASIEKPADLAADIEAVAALNERPRRRVADLPLDLAHPDAIQVCLLLRLGQANLAEKAWATLLGPEAEAGTGLALASSMYTYDQLVRDLTWNLYSQATSAFERGDDSLALHDTRLLTRIARDYDQDATARGVKPPRLAGADRPSLRLEYLARLPNLLADLERRVRESARPAVPSAGKENQSARIAALIRDLDRIGPDPSGRNDSPNLFQNKTVLALAGEGDAAVIPLIDAFRRDDRLIRVVRDGMHRRDLTGVAELEFYALTKILNSSDFGGGPAFVEFTIHSPEKRQELADRIQIYWNHRKDRAVAERWYLSLADEKAGQQEWFAAARKIVEVEAERPWSGGLPPAGRSVKPPRLSGESLRSRHKPTVTALLARRADQLIEKGDWHSAGWMADCLLAWDPSAALPTLQKTSRLLLNQIDHPRPGQSASRFLPTLQLARYVVPRVQQGDRTAAADYAAILRRSQPRDFEVTLDIILDPLRRLPDDPALAKVADWMFNDPASPWTNLGMIEPLSATINRSWAELLNSALLLSPGFRRGVLSRLDDKTPFGTVQLAGTKQWKISTRTGFEDYDSREEPTPHEVTNTKPMPFRLGDFIAWQLAKLEGCPRIDLSWSEAERDAAILAIQAYFERFGTRLVADDPLPHARRPYVDPKLPPFPMFPSLDHPATAVDVAEHRALFTLDQPNGPPAERRLVPLPDHPIFALWEPPRVFPKRGEQTPRVSPFTERTGRVWQAEEILEDGRWHRYFGMALPHRFARIPAEEMSFFDAFQVPSGPGPGWYPADLNPPDTPAPPEDRSDEPAAFALGAPVIVPIRFRNTTGLDLNIPTEPFRRVQGRVVGVDRRLRITLTFEASLPRDQYGRLMFNGQASQKIPLRSDLDRFAADDPHQTLGPAGSLATVEVNLHDLFAIDRPGRYALRVAYPGPVSTTPGGSMSEGVGPSSQPIAVIIGPVSPAP